MSWKFWLVKSVLEEYAPLTFGIDFKLFRHVVIKWMIVQGYYIVQAMNEQYTGFVVSHRNVHMWMVLVHQKLEFNIKSEIPNMFLATQVCSITM